MSTGSRVSRVVWVAAGLAGVCLAGSAWMVARGTVAAPAAGHLAAAAGLFVAAVVLRVDIRVGSNRLVFLWSDTAFVLALLLLPLPWVVPVTTVGKAAAMAILFGPVKCVYNTAAHALAATASTAAVAAVGGMSAAWPASLGMLLAAGVVYDLLCTALAAAVVATANGTNPITVWRGSLRMQALTMVGNLAVTVGALAIASLDRRLILALPAAAVVLHHAYQTAQRGRAERDSGRQLSQAISALSHLDEATILSQTAARAAELLSADGAEVIHYTAPTTAAGEVFSFPDGESAHGHSRWTQAVDLLDPDGEQPVGEIRVHFNQPVRLAERDHAALQALAAATRNALSAAKAHAEVAYLATHDPVTSLPTRQLLLQQIDAHLGTAPATRPVGMIIIRLVEFAEVARALGHEANDDLLRHVADRLRRARAGDEITARLDGYDLAVFIPDVTNLRDLNGRVDSLLAALSAPITVSRATTISLAAAGGITYAPPSNVDAIELLRQATVALTWTSKGFPIKYYRAVNDTSSGPTILLVAAEFQEALHGDQLILFYDPIIDLNDGTPVAAEAFVHWLHPTRGGLFPPDELLPVLDHASLLGPYTDWLLHHALAERARWTDLEPSLPVSINLPANCLLDSGLPHRVARALSDASLAPGQLMLELPEVATLTAMTTIDPVLEELLGLGVRIAIDDVGSSANSLTRLTRIPATDVKISSEIVTTMIRSAEARAIAAAAAELARSVDLQVTAIGARTAEQLLAACNVGVHAAQGTVFHRLLRWQRGACGALAAHTPRGSHHDSSRDPAPPRPRPRRSVMTCSGPAAARGQPAGLGVECGLSLTTGARSPDESAVAISANAASRSAGSSRSTNRIPSRLSVSCCTQRASRSVPDTATGSPQRFQPRAITLARRRQSVGLVRTLPRQGRRPARPQRSSPWRTRRCPHHNRALCQVTRTGTSVRCLTLCAVISSALSAACPHPGQHGGRPGAVVTCAVQTRRPSDPRCRARPPVAPAAQPVP